MKKSRIPFSCLICSILLTNVSDSQQAIVAQETSYQSAAQPRSGASGGLRPSDVFSFGTSADWFPGWLSSVSQENSRFSDPTAPWESRQPPAANRNRDQQPRVDGTWREENDYVIIQLDGRELRLAKNPVAASNQRGATAASASRADSAPISQTGFAIEPSSSATPAGGSVRGRLLNRGRPLSNCKVSLLPLRRTASGYSLDERAEPYTGETDEDGVYRFENAASGPYKLFWLPRGQKSWIRRIEYKPDVTVRTGELSEIKEIRTALRTVN